MNLKQLLEAPPWEWPEDTGKLLRKVLTDRTAKTSDRMIAAKLGGDMVVIDDALVDALLMVVGSASEPEELRAKAAISLGPVLAQTSADDFDDELDPPSISEATFLHLQDSLRKMYLDHSLPKEVRRRILEASIRAPEDWHKESIAAAYASRDREWMLTAVFAMGRVRGFAPQILEALQSEDPQIHLEAVRAAGGSELDAAWPHVLDLVEDPDTEKSLLLAAIEALGEIRPREAGPHLVDLMDSEDEEIAEAAEEAMMMADALGQGDEDDEAEEWVN